MSLFNKEKIHKGKPIQPEEQGPPDPLAGEWSPEDAAPGAGADGGMPERPADPKNLEEMQGGDVVRIRELEKSLVRTENDIAPETVVSMYMPRRRAARFGAALLRMDKLYLALLALLLVVASLFILSFMQEKMGNFTINLNRLELYRKGISIASDKDFTDATARLVASALDEATNITWTDIPEDVDEIDGDHNGKNYVAYTYYVRNAGKEDVSYVARLTMDASSKGSEYAVRVAVWRNGERTIYAEPSATGEPEEGCVNFESHYVVCSYYEENFLVGNVDKYTIVIWLEGEDPECVDAIVGGSLEFDMKIEAEDEEDTGLLRKFIDDIRDTITGNKPISAAGTESPDYEQWGGVTWDTRRNKDNIYRYDDETE